MSGLKKIGDWKFKQNLRKLQAAKINMPLIIGNEAVNHFKEGFVMGGGQTDLSLGGWKKRIWSKNPSILVKSGRLKRSIGILFKKWDAIIIGTRGIKYASIHNFGGEIPITAKMRKFFFAMWMKSQGKAASLSLKTHKETYQSSKIGSQNAGDAKFWWSMFKKKNPIVIPKREFIGRSAKLRKRIQWVIKMEMKKIMK